jgi:hypothetical protein
MAQNDPYTTATFGLAASGTTVFDGSDSSTGAAIVSGLAGNGDAEIRLQSYDGTAWVTTTQLADANGNATFSGLWHTQFNRVMVNGGGTPTTGDQRIQVTNVSGGAIDVAADGDER